MLSRPKARKPRVAIKIFDRPNIKKRIACTKLNTNSVSNLTGGLRSTHTSFLLEPRCAAHTWAIARMRTVGTILQGSPGCASAYRVYKCTTKPTEIQHREQRYSRYLYIKARTCASIIRIDCTSNANSKRSPSQKNSRVIFAISLSQFSQSMGFYLEMIEQYNTPQTSLEKPVESLHDAVNKDMEETGTNVLLPYYRNSLIRINKRWTNGHADGRSHAQPACDHLCVKGAREP